MVKSFCTSNTIRQYFLFCIKQTITFVFLVYIRVNLSEAMDCFSERNKVNCLI